MDLDVKVKATMLGATFLIVSSLVIFYAIATDRRRSLGNWTLGFIKS